MKPCQLTVTLIALIFGLNTIFPVPQETMLEFWTAIGMLCIIVVLFEILPKFIRRAIKDPDFAGVMGMCCMAAGCATAANMAGVDMDTCVWIMYAILMVCVVLKIAAKMYIRKKSENKI